MSSEGVASGAGAADQQGSSRQSQQARRAERSRQGRRFARELAVQGGYNWLMTGDDIGVIDAFLRASDEYHQCDHAYYQKLLQGVLTRTDGLSEAVLPYLDRPWLQVSAVERSVLMLAVFELQHCPEVPYRVVINEAIELAKSMGGNDGFKYINGVLDRAVPKLREVEWQAKQQANQSSRTAT